MGGYKKQLKGLHHDIDGPMVVCPFCKADFDYMDDEAHCHKCGKVFSAKNGILCFGSEDAFYEGKFTETKDWSLGQNSGMKKIFKAFYRSISIGAFESRFLSKQLKKIIHGDQAWILDFGCGGGGRDFAGTWVRNGRRSLRVIVARSAPSLQPGLSNRWRTFAVSGCVF